MERVKERTRKDEWVQRTFTVHVDEGIGETSEIGVFATHDDGSCAETLGFSDLIGGSRKEKESGEKTFLFDKRTVTALYEGDPGLLWVRAMRADVTDGGTG